MNPTTESLTARLRQCIAAEHEAIEKTPYSMALMQGTLDRHAYAMTISQMYWIHEKLETLAAEHPGVQAYMSSEMIRSHVIDRDLKQLGFDRTQLSVLPATSRCLESCETQVAECPESMIGGLYILEGSRMGSLVLAKPLSQSLGISGEPNSGIDYHIDGARTVPMRLKAWKIQVDEAHFDDRTRSRIEAFAGAFMKQLLDVYAAIPVKEIQRNVA